MKWHYVDQGQQAGPVSDAELLKLYQQGTITADSLVRSTEQDQWIPFRDAKLETPPEVLASPPSPPAAAAPPLQNPTNPNEVICSECGKIFPAEETIRYGNARVCAGCKPIFLQKLAEGARLNTGELNYAGFWIRFAAKFIDGLILGLPFGVIWVLVVIAYPPGGTTRGQPLPWRQVFCLFCCRWSSY